MHLNEKDPKEWHHKQHTDWRRNGSHLHCTTLMWWFCCGVRFGGQRRRGFRLQNFDDHLLSPLAVSSNPTDEIEQARFIQFEDSGTVVGEEYRMSRVTFIVLFRSHHQNWVFLVLETWIHIIKSQNGVIIIIFLCFFVKC